MKEINIQCQQSYTIPTVIAYSFDELSKNLYILDTEYNIHKIQYSVNSIKIISTFKVNNEILNNSNNSKILSFQYLIEQDSLILVFTNGAILKIQQENVDVVGQFECGVLCAQWNPNQEQLIVLCSDGKLVSFDSQLEPTKEVNIEGLQEQEASISFKNDGKFFSINYAVNINQQQNGRICQTYDSQLEIFKSASKSDPEGGLVQTMFEKPKSLINTVAWQPNSGFIAGIQDQQVIFWEKNGLRHLEFELNDCIQLQWSIDGIILAGQYQNGIKLTLRQNYKWYQKRIILIEQLKQFCFIENNTLVTFSENKMTFYWLNYLFENSKIGLSIDNSTLLVSDYSKGVIPPPLSHYQLNVNSQIQLVHYNQYIFIYTINQTLYIYDGNTLIGQCQFNIEQSPHKFLFYLDKTKEIIFGHAIFIIHENDTDQIIDILLSPQFEIINIWKKQFSQNTQITSITNNEQVITLHSRFAEKFIYDQTKEHCLAEFELSNQEKDIFDIKIEQHNQWLACLKSNQKLMLNNTLVTNECTSFAFYDHFLAFTINTIELFHNLYILDLNKPILIDKKSLNISNIERGAKILSIVALDRLIVQIPRGNLETTAPRVMVLYLCKQLYDQKQFKKCFEMIRKHKLDMNLLFDFNGELHLEIIEQLNEQYLQLFIQSLNNTISSELQYVVSQEQLKQIQASINTKIVGSSKINYICQQLINNMKEDTHILTIVTAMLKKEPSEVEQALLKALQIKQHEYQKDEVPPHLNPDTHKPYKKQHKIKSEQVLEYICWLADANKMFEVALGTYDFDLVKQVAQFTQKDPKEYLPQLERYSMIANQIDMKSTIQIELKNYDKAIQVLSQGSNEQKQQSINLMRKYSRFRVGIEIYRNDIEMLKLVKDALGDYLLTQKQFHQASLAFESAGYFEKALKASIEILDTERVLSFQPQETKQYLESLLSSGRWKDCGMVEEYQKNYSQAVHYYCKAEEWEKVTKCLRFNQINIDDHLNLTFQLKSNLLLNQQLQFLQKIERLRIVQEQKREHGILAPTQLQADFDQISDVSGKSGVSKSSYTMSVTTGVRKRKPKEKSFLNRNIKEGSPVEEEYLVEFLKDIQLKSTEIINSIKKFQNYLIYFNKPSLSQELSIKVKEYLRVINVPIKGLTQIIFEEQNPQALELYDQKSIVQGEFNQALDELIK